MRRQFSYFLSHLNAFKSRKRRKDSDEAMGPPIMTDGFHAQYCGYVTLLKSTLLLSLLTPTLDGLLSTPLLPSKLFGTEFGDTIGPGRKKGTKDKTDGYHVSTQI